MADHPDEWSEDYWRPTMHFSREHVAEALTAERLRSGSIKGLTEERKNRMIESERAQKVETAKRDDCTVRDRRRRRYFEQMIESNRLSNTGFGSLDSLM